MLLEQQLVNRFVTFAIKYGDFENEDAIYIQNRLLAILNAEGIDQKSSIPDSINSAPSPNDITQYWIQQAIEQQMIEDALYNKEIIEAQILDLITPKPSMINQRFFEAYKEAPQNATDYFMKFQS